MPVLWWFFCLLFFSMPWFLTVYQNLFLWDYLFILFLVSLFISLNWFLELYFNCFVASWRPQIDQSNENSLHGLSMHQIEAIMDNRLVIQKMIYFIYCVLGASYSFVSFWYFRNLLLFCSSKFFFFFSFLFWLLCEILSKHLPTSISLKRL